MYYDRTTINYPEEESPRLIVVIDTEEEFDWSSEPRRDADSVSAMNEIEVVQNIFDEYGVVPCYVVDYPVASKQEGYKKIKDIYLSGRCEIGAHLHPWVNPPFDEQLTRFNTYPGNLPKNLEKEKLKVLHNTIKETFGIETKIYKAGRYGYGMNTTHILEECGFEIDLSICPPIDYSGDGGPNYSDYNADPFWYGRNKLLALPVTGAFVGWAGGISTPLYRFADKLKKMRVPGMLAKISAVDRLILSPEGFSTRNHIDLTNYLYRKGVKTFTWSFHSPSIVPGCTPYVKSEKDLSIFLDSFRRYFDFFFGQFQGKASTPTKIRQLLERN